MKKFVSVLIFTLIFLFSFVLFTHQAHADTNFDTSFTGTYAVQPTGITHGTFTVTLKNLTDRYYPTSYALQLGFADIENIRASDSEGAIAPVVKKTTDGQELHFTLNHRAIGLGAKETITFSFDTPNVATENGNVWEVNIPGLKNSSDFSKFSVNLVVPLSFGPPAYVKPNGGSTLTFTKDQLGQSGISLAFGDSQVYHLKLSYHLKNNQIFPVHTKIALPSNTSYQTISLDSISPKPLHVTEDPDGNWMAEYSLLPSQLLTVQVDARAFVSLRPHKQTESKATLTSYLKSSSYWQTSDHKIAQLAQQLKTPYAIYEYVVKTLHYDFGRVNDNQQRLGAVAVLAHPTSAVCLEFTDLFIALARAAGIPAREIDGYAYTQNSRERPLSLQKDILHAWPEYYDQDQQTWVMVDPTWENTTGGVDYFHVFDYDHIAFVVKGMSPDYPIPAGGYKLPGQKDQDVSVTFAENTLLPDPTSTFDFQFPASNLAGIPIDGTVTLTNTSSVLFPAQDIALSTTLSGFADQHILSSDVPPYGKVHLPLRLGSAPILTNQKSTVTILLAGVHVSKPIVIVPFTASVGIIGGIILGSLIITVFIITRRSRRLSIS